MEKTLTQRLEDCIGTLTKITDELAELEKTNVQRKSKPESSPVVGRGVAAALLGASPSTVTRLCKNGRLAHYYVGKQLRIFVSSIDIFKENNNNVEQERG